MRSSAPQSDWPPLSKLSRPAYRFALSSQASRLALLTTASLAVVGGVLVALASDSLTAVAAGIAVVGYLVLTAAKPFRAFQVHWPAHHTPHLRF